MTLDHGGRGGGHVCAWLGGCIIEIPKSATLKEGGARVGRQWALNALAK